MWMPCTLAMGFCQNVQTLPRRARMLGCDSLGPALRLSVRWVTRWRPGPLPLLQVRGVAGTTDPKSCPEGLGPWQCLWALTVSLLPNSGP